MFVLHYTEQFIQCQTYVFSFSRSWRSVSVVQAYTTHCWIIYQEKVLLWHAHVVPHYQISNALQCNLIVPLHTRALGHLYAIELTWHCTCRAWVCNLNERVKHKKHAEAFTHALPYTSTHKHLELHDERRLNYYYMLPEGWSGPFPIKSPEIWLNESWRLSSNKNFGQ